MPRNITAAQKFARDFHKSDALSHTNQIKYSFFSHGAENTHKESFSRRKNRTKNPGDSF